MTMPDVSQLLHEFIERDRASGPADPTEFLERVSGAERTELEALIDAYLARAPRRPFDRAAFAASPARAVADELGRALGGVSGSWPALLPRLRHRAQLPRSEVVRRLGAELGVTGERPATKVARYYHEMEQGTLPAAGVADRVLEALGRVLGVGAQRLRDAGRTAAGGAPGPSGMTAFARVGAPDPQFVPADALSPVASQPPEPRDEIDELFTGASGSSG